MNELIRKTYLSLIENVQERKNERQLLLDKEEDDFFNSLDENQKKLFCKISEIYTAKLAEGELAFFKEGVKLGLFLTMDFTLS